MNLGISENRGPSYSLNSRTLSIKDPKTRYPTILETPIYEKLRVLCLGLGCLEPTVFRDFGFRVSGCCCQGFSQQDQQAVVLSGFSCLGLEAWF